MWSLSRNSVGRGRSDLARSSSCSAAAAASSWMLTRAASRGKGAARRRLLQTAALDAARSCDPGFPLLWYCLRRADRGWSSRSASARLVVVTVDQAKMGEGTRGRGGWEGIRATGCASRARAIAAPRSEGRPRGRGMGVTLDLLINAMRACCSAGSTPPSRRRVDLLRHARHRQHRPSRPSSCSARTSPTSPTRAFGIDPILASVVAAAGVLSARGRRSTASTTCRSNAAASVAARPGVLLRPAVHHRGHAGPGVRRRLPPGGRALYRSQPASRRRSSCRCACWCRAWSRWR